MPKLRKDTQAARVQHILAAAEACFARKGFEATTIADICDEAGVSVGALYSHFSGKEELVEAICTPAVEHKRQALEALAEQDAPLSQATMMLEQINAMLSSRQGLSDAALDLHLWSESLRNARLRKLTREAFRDLETGLARLVLNSQRRGEMPAGLSPRAVATLLVAAVAGLEVRRSLGLDSKPPDILAVFQALAEPGKYQ